MALVAALESVPQMVALPLAAHAGNMLYNTASTARAGVAAADD